MMVFIAVSSNRIELSNGKYRFHGMPHRIANTLVYPKTKKTSNNHLKQNEKNPDFNDDFAFVRKSHVLFWPRISFAFRMKHSEAIKAVFWLFYVVYLNFSHPFFSLLSVCWWSQFGWMISAMADESLQFVFVFKAKKKFFRRFSSIHAIYGK